MKAMKLRPRVMTVILGIGLMVLTPAANADQASIAADADAKAKSCDARSLQSDEAATCAKLCAAVSYRLQKRRNMSPDNIEQVMVQCDQAYAAAGFDPTAEPAPPPSIDESNETMQAKGEYCAEQLAQMTCTLNDFGDATSLCANARMCEVQCANTENTEFPGTYRESDKESRREMARAACLRSYKMTLKHLSSG